MVCGGLEEIAGLGMLRWRDWVTIGVRRIVMSTRPVLEPTASHPITVEPTGKRVSVRVNGELVADTDEALTLQESTYPAVQYIPLRDVVEQRLQPSDTETYCPYKGDASYYHVVTEAG